MLSKAVNMRHSYLISDNIIIIVNLIISVEISIILVLWINTRTLLLTLVDLCRCNLALNAAFLPLTRCTSTKRRRCRRRSGKNTRTTMWRTIEG